MKFIRKQGIIWTIIILLNISIAHAAALDSVTRTMRYIFFNMSGTSAFQVWLKFALFIILFAVLYNAGIRAMRANEEGRAPLRRALAIITFIIALTSAIFVPYKLLLYIFKLYHAILVVLFAMIPVAVGFFVTRIESLREDNRTNRIIKGIIYVMMALVTFGLIGQIEANSSPETKIYMDVLEPLLWGAIIALIAGLYNLIMAMGGDYVANQVAQRLGIGQTTPQQGPPGQNVQNQNAPPTAANQQLTPAQRLDQISQFEALLHQMQGYFQQHIVPLMQNPTMIPYIQAIQKQQLTPQQLQQVIQNATPVAQQIVPHIQQMQQFIQQGQQLLNNILGDHAAYQQVPEPVRQGFELNIVHFLNIQQGVGHIYHELHAGGLI